MTTPLIVSNRQIMMGKPVVAGTRIMVESILERLAAGKTKQQLPEAHPRLSEPVIAAVLQFASAIRIRSRNCV